MEGDNGVQLEATHRPGIVPGADGMLEPPDARARSRNVASVGA